MSNYYSYEPQPQLEPEPVRRPRPVRTLPDAPPSRNNPRLPGFRPYTDVEVPSQN